MEICQSPVETPFTFIPLCSCDFIQKSAGIESPYKEISKKSFRSSVVFGLNPLHFHIIILFPDCESWRPFESHCFPSEFTLRLSSHSQCYTGLSSHSLSIPSLNPPPLIHPHLSRFLGWSGQSAPWHSPSVGIDPTVWPRLSPSSWDFLVWCWSDQVCLAPWGWT